MNEKIKYKEGFTLAEILVSLLIIGVIASLTIPAIINSVNKADYVVRFKKTVSVLSQALDLYAVDYGGDIASSGLFASGSINAMNGLSSKLRIIKNCGNSMGCWYDTKLYFLNGSYEYSNLDTSWDGQYGKAILADGTMLRMNDSSGNCTADVGTGSSPLRNAVCAELAVDINGEQKPNTWGRDVFQFYITQTGIYPRGSFDDGYFCDIAGSGKGCAANVFLDGAMNY